MPYRPISVSHGVKHVMTNPGALAAQGFRPHGQPELWVYPETAHNPVSAEERDDVQPALIGVFVMGLTTNKAFGPPREFKAEVVREDLMKKFPVGGTMAAQYGWYQAVPEDSIRVTIENSNMGLSDPEFKKLFTETVGELAEKYRQQEIWYDFFRGTEKVGKGMTMKYWE